VHRIQGIGLIATGAALGLVTIGMFRRRFGATSFVLSAIAGLCVAAGGLLVQRDVGVGDWVVASVTLGAIAPIHNRVLLGAPGGRG
jgi:hypothetical protein